jgi:HAD superfamily hydrolase (TIGR01490 family)
MDHTVLDTDCDLSWKYFLVDEGLAPPSHRAEADRFFDLYHQQRTPVNEFVKFQLSEFVNRSSKEMRILADQHFQERVLEYIYPQAQKEITKFNQLGISTFLLTGTNRIIAEPIARSLGVSILLATEPETKNGLFTGSIDGPFLMKGAKLQAASDICISRQIKLDNVTFYADSITDVALLEKIGYPIVINPREDLRAIAVANQWRIEDWQLKGKHSSFSRFHEKMSKEIS